MPQKLKSVTPAKGTLKRTRKKRPVGGYRPGRTTKGK
jgi:hypothetical protein